MYITVFTSFSRNKASVNKTKLLRLNMSNVGYSENFNGDERNPKEDDYKEEQRRPRIPTEKYKLNRITELTKRFWKQNTKCASIIRDTADDPADFTANQKFIDMSFTDIEKTYDELLHVSPTMNLSIRQGMDRLQFDRNLLMKSRKGDDGSHHESISRYESRSNHESRSHPESRSNHESRSHPESRSHHEPRSNPESRSHHDSQSYHDSQSHRSPRPTHRSQNSMHSHKSHNSRSPNSERSSHSHRSYQFSHYGLSSRQSHISHQSYNSRYSETSSKLMEATANVAARRAELAAMRETITHELELHKLELEEDARRAEAESRLQKKRNELDITSIEGKLRVEEAKVKCYEHGFNEPPRASLSNSPQQSFQLNELAEALNLNRLPVPEPTVFNGEPLKYHDWKISFNALIDKKNIPAMDKIHYLKRYLSGPAREAVSGYFILQDDSSYERAKSILEKRYGDPFIVTESFRQKLNAWPKIPPRDGESLQRFSDFLNQCVAAMAEISGLQILNDNHENRKMLLKLPESIVTRWSRIVAKSKRTTGAYPLFKEFAEFLTDESEIACDPITSLESLRNSTEKDEKHRASPKRSRIIDASSFATEADPTKTDTCAFCKYNHNVTECRILSRKLPNEKQEFVKKNGLCFGCLQQGHLSKSCTNKSTCSKCQKPHPTSLHLEQKPATETHDITYPKPILDATAGDIVAVCHDIQEMRKKTMSSMIVPVWVSSQSNSKEILVYALLDTQSDTTFILDDIAEETGAIPLKTALKLTTMTSKSQLIQCNRFQDLTIRGYTSEIVMPLSSVYTREFIPADIRHIPTNETARKWPHLSAITN